jgi:multiple sugar transport system substrate-binding protein
MEISGYAITRESKNQEAAWEYIKFITGPVGQSIWTVTGMPSRTSIINQFAAGKAPGSKYAPFYKPFLATLSNARWTPFVAKSAEVENDLTNATAPMWLGSESAQQATQQLGKQLRSLLGS